MTQRSIILLEANEIPFKVFDYFCNRQPHSALASLFNRSWQYRTHTEDKSQFIMPWTTWPSFHRGVNDEAHRIFRFGQWELESELKFPPLWSLLARNKVSTGIFSSMQSSKLPENKQDYAFFFPDMFATSAATQPEELEILQEFNLVMTRESARNVSRRVDMHTGARVLANSRKLGIKASTYVDIAKQITSEIIIPARKTRRRAYQPLLMFDVFYKQLQQSRPRFSTFFTNHVAASMHRYWAAVFPEDYQTFQLDQSWVKKFRNEIDFAMSKLDKIVGALAQFVDKNPDYMLAIATSMGQAAIPASHVLQFLTITDVSVFLAAMGLRKEEYEERAAMVPDFSFCIAANKADEFEANLLNVTIGGVRPRYHRDNRFFHVSIYDERQNLQHAMVGDTETEFQKLGIGYLIQEDEVGSTAQHIPQGALIIYSPATGLTPPSVRPDISALDFAPSVLRHFGIDVPSYMKKANLLQAC